MVPRQALFAAISMLLSASGVATVLLHVCAAHHAHQAGRRRIAFARAFGPAVAAARAESGDAAPQDMTPTSWTDFALEASFQASRPGYRLGIGMGAALYAFGLPLRLGLLGFAAALALPATSPLPDSDCVRLVAAAALMVGAHIWCVPWACALLGVSE